MHVPFCELYAIFVCVLMHAASWSGLVVRFGCVCSALNKGTSADPFLLLLLRYIGALRALYRFDLVAEHCCRECNTLADCATRHVCMQDFRPHLAYEGFS